MSAPLVIPGGNNHFDYESRPRLAQKNLASTTVTIPDMFVSFAAKKPSVNPFYEAAKRESEAWITSELGLGQKEQEKQRKGDLAYFAAVAYPDAGPEELRNACDWCLWFIAFDDLFDEGALSMDLNMATKEVQSLLATMKPAHPEEGFLPGSPHVEAFRSIWLRVASRSSQGTQRRFIESMTKYCSGLLDQVHAQNSSILDLESYLALRRKVTAVYPLLSFNEYVHALDIPDIVFENKSLQEIEEVTTDIVLLQNDVVSYHREQALGVNNNLPSFYRTKGHSQQSAYDVVGELIKARYRKWYSLQSELPHWSERIDSQVQKYLKGCQDVVLANINWSFQTERYFGKQKDEVRKTRIVATLPW